MQQQRWHRESKNDSPPLLSNKLVLKPTTALAYDPKHVTKRNSGLAVTSKGAVLSERSRERLDIIESD